MTKLSTLGAFKVKLAKALGLSLPGIIKLTIGDLAAQREKQKRTRRLPRYNAGNPYGDNIPREFQDYEPPYLGGVGSNITPPLSDEEFRLNFFISKGKVYGSPSGIGFTEDSGPAGRL